ncbi:MAG: hypothetical protein DRQ55_07025 [Planctomycetota bacterium]|nr:MAG: hypothetical protein DRQ55_07025 [Planctomycetota bacterium]
MDANRPACVEGMTLVLAALLLSGPGCSAPGETPPAGGPPGSTSPGAAIGTDPLPTAGPGAQVQRRDAAPPAGCVAVRGVGFGSDEAQARSQALTLAHDEAARRRGTAVKAWLYDVMSSSGDEHFEVGSVQSAQVSIAGATHRVVDLQTQHGRVRVELELYVPREQIEPARVLDELMTAPAPLPRLREFATRAEGRGDVPAAHLAYQRMFQLETRADDLLQLVALYEGQGELESAILVLDRWASQVQPRDPRLDARRTTLAERLADPHADVAALLSSAARMPPGALALRPDHDRASVHDAVRVRGAVARDLPLLLVWFDGQSIGVLASYDSAELATGRLDVDLDYYDPELGRVDTTEFVPGPVSLLAVACSPLAMPPTPIDLSACERGDMAQRRRLRQCLDTLQELLRRPGARAQVLGWDQIDE